MATSSSTNTDAEIQVSVEDLPMTFKVKYIGSEASRGLWGIKHTRRPVEEMVAKAKNLPANKSLLQCELKVDTDQVSILTPKGSIPSWQYSIDSISYGVQDLVYTRVFAMIVVNEVQSANPFEVHAFVCDSRLMARQLTFALAAAFQNYSRKVKEEGENTVDRITPTRQKFAIDLRSPEELLGDANDETEA